MKTLDSAYLLDCSPQRKSYIVGILKKELTEIAKLFLMLGTIGFGGPAAHIAMMQNEVVHKRKWIDEQHFLDLIGATNLIPGPNSTEMAIHIGRERAGWKGLIVAGLCFILPAILITGVFAAFYKKYGQLPEIQSFIYGIKPAIIAVIIAAVYPLARKSFKSVELGIIGIMSLVFCLSGVNEIYVLFGTGFFTMALTALRNRKKNLVHIFSPLSLLGTGILSTGSFGLFFTFLKIGAVLYGSGYVLFAFLDTELVAKGILSRQQLIDAIAVGQLTPGPVFSSATFIGYQINNAAGALAATIGIFLPAFLFVALLNPLVRRLRNSRLLSVFLDGVNVASIAIIADICLKMGKDALIDWRSVVIAAISLAIVFGFKKINTALVVLCSSVLGYLLTFL